MLVMHKWWVDETLARAPLWCVRPGFLCTPCPHLVPSPMSGLRIAACAENVGFSQERCNIVNGKTGKRKCFTNMENFWPASSMRPVCQRGKETGEMWALCSCRVRKKRAEYTNRHCAWGGASYLTGLMSHLNVRKKRKWVWMETTYGISVTQRKEIVTIHNDVKLR